MKPRLIINGAAGRMGRRIAALAVEAGRFDIIAAVDSADHPDIGADAGVLARVDKLGIELGTDLPKKADCLIDFSLPQAADGVIEHCRSCGIALVMGTTGLSDEQVRAVHTKVYMSVLAQYADDWIITAEEREALRRFHECLRKAGWAPGD